MRKYTMIGILPLFVYLKKTMYKNTFKPNTKTAESIVRNLFTSGGKRNGASAH